MFKRCQYLLGIVAVALVAAPLALGGHAVAEGGGGQVFLEASVGFDGHARYSSAVPIFVKVVNNDLAFSGKVVVKTAEGNPIQVRTDYEEEFYVGAGGEKQFRFLIPFTSLHDNQIDIHILSGEDSLASTSVFVHMVDGVIFGVVSAGVDTLRQLDQMRMFSGFEESLPSMERVYIVDLEAADIPDNSAGLHGLDVLMIDGFASDELTAEKWRAITLWVEGGGVLVLAGGPTWRRTFAFVPDVLLPVDVTGISEICDLSSLELISGVALSADSAVVSTGVLRRGVVLASYQDIPLIVKSALGKGTVFYSAFSFGVEPLYSWVGVDELWSGLLRSVISPGLFKNLSSSTNMYSVVDTDSTRGVLTRIARAASDLSIPSVKTFGIIVFVYVFLLVPFTYLYLKYRKRVYLTWVALPILAVVISTVVYGVTMYSGNRLRVASVASIVTLAPNTDLATVQSVVGVFAPSKKSVEVSIPASVAAAHCRVNLGRYGSMYSSSQVMSPSGTGGSYNSSDLDVFPSGARVTTSANKTSIFLSELDSWTMRNSYITTDVQLPGSLEADLVLSGNRIVGTLTNNLETELEDLVFVVGQWYQVLGDLAPGDAVEVDVSISHVCSSEFSQALYWKLMEYNAMYTGNRAYMDQATRQKLDFVSSVVGISGQAVVEPTIFGWSNMRPLDVTVTDVPITSEMTMILIPLRLDADAHAGYVIPQGIVRARFVGIEENKQGVIVSQGQSWSAYGQSIGVRATIPTGVAAIFEAELPYELPDVLEALGATFATDSWGRITVAQVSFYNWTTGTWDSASYDASSGMTAVVTSDVRDYISSDNKIRVRNESSAIQTALVEPWISLKGANLE